MTSRRLIRAFPDELSDAAEALLRRRGFSRRESADIARYCTQATSEGHLEHGVGALWVLDQQGELTPGQGAIRVSFCNRRSIRVSAKSYLGFLPATRAVEALSRVVRRNSTPVCATLISRGFRGRLGHIVRPIAALGHIGIAIGSTAPVVQYKSQTAALGTNPIAIAVPIVGGVIVSDMATARTTYTRRFIRRGPIDTSDTPPLHLWGGHRGMALSVAIQALSAAATGVPLLPSEHWGLVILAIPTYKSRPNESNEIWTQWIEELGLRWLPGQRSDARRERAERNGVYVPGWLWKWLESAAK